MKPTIIIDNHIPYIKGALDSVANIHYLPSTDITREKINALHADALIIRTRTKCNDTTLNGTNVKFIATATIGTDHIDSNYCSEHGIIWKNAPGCNANSVAQYIASALTAFSLKTQTPLHGKTIGIVGHGHVGTKVETICQQLGMTTLLCDPPKAESTPNKYTDIKTIAENSDIITIHTPLTHSGKYPTYHLIDQNIINHIKRQPLLINAARGGIIDEIAILKALDNQTIADVVIDCWENEPNINPILLNKALLATPHIAGYSADGKLNATNQAVEAICSFFNLNHNCIDALPPQETTYARNELLANQILKNYNIKADSDALKSTPTDFEKLRNNYHIRRELDIC